MNLKTLPPVHLYALASGIVIITLASAFIVIFCTGLVLCAFSLISYPFSRNLSKSAFDKVKELIDILLNINFDNSPER